MNICSGYMSPSFLPKLALPISIQRFDIRLLMVKIDALVGRVKLRVVVPDRVEPAAKCRILVIHSDLLTADGLSHFQFGVARRRNRDVSLADTNVYRDSRTRQTRRCWPAVAWLELCEYSK